MGSVGVRRRAAACAFLAASLLGAGPQTAGAQEPGPTHPMVFPVIGEVSWTDTYGAPRGGGRSHEGQDLLGVKGQELVAAADGEVTFLTTSSNLGGIIVEITGDDGWAYTYIHLNNDSPGTDDGAATREETFGPGIEEGARVVAGQLVGYLGDSGNAEETSPHLHFELHDPSGTTVNPAAALRAAPRLAAPAAGASPSSIPRLAGADRVATAVEVSRSGWPEGAAEVVLASGTAFAEALPATVLAATVGAPVLLTTGTTLPVAVGDELRRLGARRVTVVGSVPEAVAAAAGEGRALERVAGADAVRTSVAVAGRVGGGAGVAVLVNLERFADAVSASVLAAGRGWPILLTTASTVPQATVDAWRALGVRRVVLVGGEVVIGANIERFVRDGGRCAGGAGCEVERLADDERYGTSLAVAERSLALGGRSTSPLYLPTGTAYADSVAAGTLAARRGGIAVLVDGSGRGHDADVLRWLERHAAQLQDVAIVGGTVAVTPTADRALQRALGLT